jgi:ParB/RepB/Spo0J family partition protein
MDCRPIAIDMIIVNERQRKTIEREPLQSLADDIEKHGLLHPVVITRDGTLMAGERRLEACKLLGWTHIPANFLDELSFREQFLIEFTENERRQSLTWEERTKAIATYHAICISEEGPKWTQEDSARDMGLKQASVSQYLKVNERLDHPLVKQATSIKTAINTVKRITEREDQDRFYGSLSTVDGYIPKSTSPIQIADFNTWAPTYTGPKFNVIHCDFPYGINSQDHYGQGRAERSSYDDSPETFWTLFKTLSIHLDNFCSPAAHMIFWFSPNIYGNVWEALKLLDGFRWDEHPLIWMRGENEGIAPDPQRRPRRCYEMAFFGWRSDRKLVKTKANIFQAPTEREVHPHEKNEAMLRHFLEMVVDSGTHLFDPSCGSGSALRAGRGLGARSVLGLEADESYAAAARQAFANNSNGSGLGRGNGLSDHVAGGVSPADQTANP